MSSNQAPSHPSGQNAVTDDRGVIYFVSDVHLGGSRGAAEAEKRERFHGLLDRVVADGASLYILGDLFDFWFEYRTVIPKSAFAMLARLDTLARSGVPIAYLGGNHDFWMCDFLRRETSLRVLSDGTELTAQGRRAHLAHGDGLGPGDTGYKLLKRVLRNRLAIRLFRWVHPDLGIALAHRSSHSSREYTADQKVDVEALYAHVGAPVLAGAADAFLMGHHHVPVHVERDGGDFMILGDWFQRYTCARLRDGKFELLTWPINS